VGRVIGLHAAVLKKGDWHNIINLSERKKIIVTGVHGKIRV
jgi:hypothetical protein